MALTNAFYKAVEEKNISRVRIMMKNSLLVDPTFDEFDEMETEAASYIDNLYEEHDGKEMVEDKSKWTDEYMHKVMTDVLFNFSRERIDHLKEVITYLNPGEDRNDIEEVVRPVDMRKGAGAAAGAVIGGVVAYAAGAATAGVVAGVAGGAVIGGVAAKVFTDGGR